MYYTNIRESLSIIFFGNLRRTRVAFVRRPCYTLYECIFLWHFIPIMITKKEAGPSPEDELQKALNEIQYGPNVPFWKSSAAFLFEIIKVVAISLAIILPVRYFLIQPFYVRGASMEPNFQDHEYLIIDEISYRFREPHRGEVIVLRDPRASQYLIKRIVALPGETIDTEAGHISIKNEEHPRGIELDESMYLDDSVQTSGTESSVNLGPDEYFVAGDNRPSSLDSRIFGPILKEDIVGRAWIRAWPPERLTIFEDITYPF